VLAGRVNVSTLDLVHKFIHLRFNPPICEKVGLTEASIVYVFE